MGRDTAITWAHHTLNVWRACDEMKLEDGSQHPACDNCYAKKFAPRNPKLLGKWGKQSEGGVRVLAPENYWAQLKRWNAAAEKAGENQRVFVNSLADTFEDFDGYLTGIDGKPRWQLQNSTFTEDPQQWEPATLNQARVRLYREIDDCNWLDFLLLTKRPERVLEGVIPYSYHACESGDCPHFDAKDCNDFEQVRYRDNVWYGTSVSNQKTAEEMIPKLLKLRRLTPVLFLSMGPLLRPVDLSKWIKELDWIIVEGESGGHSRPMHPEWVRGIRDQCVSAGKPFHFKQWGEWAPQRENSGPGGCLVVSGNGKKVRVIGVDGDPGYRDNYPWALMDRCGKSAAGRMLDGELWDQFPKGIE